MTAVGLGLGRRALGQVHDNLVFGRRVRVLSEALAAQLPRGARVLDVGAGSGDMAVAIMQLRPDVRIEGVDVLVRPGTAIPVVQYDGRHIPHADGAFDAALLIDVLHHTDDPIAVLGEVARVARAVVVKDHYRNGPAAQMRLRFMDWVGNAPHGVRLPYNYLSRAQWTEGFRKLDLQVTAIDEALALYPAPVSWLFGKGLHFVAKLQRAA
uniref:class I SAM-dependent methyltransferase n=1 Tax=uncultured Sphingomonas sp. TaxID=158754 RepID=UPI0025EA864F|nr:class I SAM-dependent methyltransferase [uncultured Sphingomonas sp.]